MTAQNMIKQSVESNVATYMEIVQALYDNPEIGNEEFESMALLVKYLDDFGFKTTSGYVVPTGFLAEYDSGKPGPTIAFMSEYDALPEIGHGCGHNLIAAIGVASGVAYKEVVDQVGGKVLVMGTPAEENFGGKVSIAEAGGFDEVDVAMMIHPSNQNSLGSRSNALYPLKFEFFGKNAHGCHPAEGASALDAAVQSYVQINMMRQFAKPHTYIHGIIRDGGVAANIVPGYASMEYYFRAPNFAYAKQLAETAREKASLIAQANDCRMESSVYECPYEDTVINYRLADALKEQFEVLGIENIHPVDEVATGSTDIGAASYKCPTVQGYLKIVPDDVVAHTIEMRDATISQEGQDALLNGAKALALTALDLATNPEKLAAIQEEHEETLTQLAAK
ncbi:M20 family metallopeptidase [Aerococcaceae bacterium DSM 111176]|nr:M20 family metallopeptidase [Aerococcaceae bacterium DSM 111176]